MRTGECAWCGAPFEYPPVGRTRLFCCDNHRHRAFEADLANRMVCPECGGPTGHTPGQRKPERCRACADALQRARERAVEAGYLRGDPPWRIADGLGLSVAAVKNYAVRLRRRGVAVPFAPTGARAHRSFEGARRDVERTG